MNKNLKRRMGRKPVATTDAAQNTILAIVEQRGKITPKEVVDEARDPNSPLHDYFTWDDGVAAERYRQLEAIRLIKSYTIEFEEAKVEVKAFVSLPSDRVSGGGYRSIAAVMSNDSMRKELENQALRELERARTKYGDITSLNDVWATIDEHL